MKAVAKSGAHQPRGPWLQRSDFTMYAFVPEGRQQFVEGEQWSPESFCCRYGRDRRVRPGPLVAPFRPGACRGVRWPANPLRHVGVCNRNVGAAWYTVAFARRTVDDIPLRTHPRQNRPNVIPQVITARWFASGYLAIFERSSSTASMPISLRETFYGYSTSKLHLGRKANATEQARSCPPCDAP